MSEPETLDWDAWENGRTSSLANDEQVGAVLSEVGAVLSEIGALRERKKGSKSASQSDRSSFPLTK